MTRQEMAEHLGVNTATITRWTRDKGKPPRPPVLREWARLCHVPYEWLRTGAGSYDEPIAYGKAAEPTATQKNAAELSATFDEWERDEKVTPARRSTDQGADRLR
jgi:transcriptional regulator with XRE-family HTH domain